MAIKSIITNINELRKPCELITKEDNLKIIMQDLVDTLKSKNGLGISANQIGYNKKISYIRIPKSIDKAKKEIQYKEYFIINAKIIEKARPIQVKNESCLSFQGIGIITQRYVFITVEYLDEKMELQTNLYQDLEAIAVQHEIDHQNCLTIFDRKWRSR